MARMARSSGTRWTRRQLTDGFKANTVDVYGHLIPGANRSAVDRLDAVGKIIDSDSSEAADGVS